MGATVSDYPRDRLSTIAQAILAAARERGAAVHDWYLDDAEYDEFARTSQALCGHPTMKICGATIHRSSSVSDLPGR